MMQNGVALYLWDAFSAVPDEVVQKRSGHQFASTSVPFIERLTVIVAALVTGPSSSANNLHRVDAAEGTDSGECSMMSETRTTP